MKIVLGSAHPYLPQLTGGAQISTHEIAKALAQRGHKVRVLAGLSGIGRTGLRSRVMLKLTGRKLASDARCGYPTHRGWFPSEGVGELTAADMPDVVLLQSGRQVPMALRFQELGVPVVLYLRNVEFGDLGGDLHSLGPVPTIANSDFTANRYREVYGLDPVVVHPTFTPGQYRTRTERSTVTFVNPRREKGVETALAMAAACPDIPFEFVEAWTMQKDERRALVSRIAALPNVTLRGRTDDMRTIYRRSRVVLVPSKWEEAFGRVAAEAHISGIPVIGARRGGLPEAIGPGGMLVDPAAGIDGWVAALRSIWDEPARYEALCNAAEAYADRSALDPEKQMTAIEQVLLKAAGQNPSAKSRGRSPNGHGAHADLPRSTACGGKPDSREVRG
ncbi:glycosyltransferase involved in cell wall biosynthesis [Cereibacter changlensis]|uniref:Glycosyltransferase involved in cell wall biosynthesis n=3 Tax=Cereibacter changlensis TaxID=402884 RepID=A0A2W7R745_9RHOB|nr:glycosyltransferase [Cereibacter changlensis]PZX50009.1 glycosyltransferase involved in cell wall biosynthesis [Cereibacter changlensis]